MGVSNGSGKIHWAEIEEEPGSMIGQCGIPGLLRLIDHNLGVVAVLDQAPCGRVNHQIRRLLPICW